MTKLLSWFLLLAAAANVQGFSSSSSASSAVSCERCGQDPCQCIIMMATSSQTADAQAKHTWVAMDRGEKALVMKMATTKPLFSSDVGFISKWGLPAAKDIMTS